MMALDTSGQREPVSLNSHRCHFGSVASWDMPDSWYAWYADSRLQHSCDIITGGFKVNKIYNLFFLFKNQIVDLSRLSRISKMETSKILRLFAVLHRTSICVVPLRNLWCFHDVLLSENSGWVGKRKENSVQYEIKAKSCWNFNLWYRSITGA